jgi:hypothetical protein
MSCTAAALRRLLLCYDDPLVDPGEESDEDGYCCPTDACTACCVKDPNPSITALIIVGSTTSRKLPPTASLATAGTTVVMMSSFTIEVCLM